jgi:ABC-type glycerol-3-phosphate transport system substrate-binding protein
LFINKNVGGYVKSKAITKVQAAIVAIIIIVAVIAGAAYYLISTPGPSPTGEVELNVYNVNWKISDANKFIDENFEATHPNIKVNYKGLADIEKERPLLLQTTPEKVDIMIMDEYFDVVRWAKAGVIVPITNMPGVRDVYNKLSPMAQADCSIGNEIYSLPWYTVVSVWAYNKRILNEAGYTKPPTTWMEMVEMAEHIKELGLCEYPIALHNMASERRVEWTWYTFAVSMGGKDYKLYDENWKPQYIDDWTAGYKAIQFMYDLQNTWKVVSPTSVTMSTTAAASELMKGTAAFAECGGFQMLSANDPATSKEAGNILNFYMPDTGWTWAKNNMWCITKSCKERGSMDAAWEFLKWWGGPEGSKWNALPVGGSLHSAYPDVEHDKEIEDTRKPYMLPDMETYYGTSENKTVSVTHDLNPAYQTTFYSMWLYDYVIPHLQKVVLAQETTSDAVHAISAGFDQLATTYGLPPYW